MCPLATRLVLSPTSSHSSALWDTNLGFGPVPGTWLANAVGAGASENAWRSNGSLNNLCQGTRLAGVLRIKATLLR